VDILTLPETGLSPYPQSVNMNTDKLYHQASTLVSAANTLAIVIYKALSDRYPLYEIDKRDWDFFITIASHASAIIRLTNKVSSEKSYWELTKILRKGLKTWDENADFALSDLMTHFDKAWQDGQHFEDKESTKLLAAILGSWCLVNFQIEVPKDEHSPLAIDIGMMIVSSFINWWDK